MRFEWRNLLINVSPYLLVHSSLSFGEYSTSLANPGSPPLTLVRNYGSDATNCFPACLQSTWTTCLPDETVGEPASGRRPGKSCSCSNRSDQGFDISLAILACVPDFLSLSAEGWPTACEPLVLTEYATKMELLCLRIRIRWPSPFAPRRR